jgi:hypothetical protein
MHSYPLDQDEESVGKVSIALLDMCSVRDKGLAEILKGGYTTSLRVQTADRIPMDLFCEDALSQ